MSNLVKTIYAKPASNAMYKLDMYLDRLVFTISKEFFDSVNTYDIVIYLDEFDRMELIKCGKRYEATINFYKADNKVKSIDVMMGFLFAMGKTNKVAQEVIDEIQNLKDGVYGKIDTKGKGKVIGNPDPYHYNVYLTDVRIVTKQVKDIFKKIHITEVVIHKKRVIDLKNKKIGEQFVTSFSYEIDGFSNQASLNRDIESKLVKHGMKRGDQYSILSNDSAVNTFYCFTNKLY